MISMRRTQCGVMLLEALIGILIFSLGILSLVAMSATAIRVQADSQYRAEAMNLAEQMASAIWSSVARPFGTVDPASLTTFQHATGGAQCAFSGASSALPATAAWLTRVQERLPGSANGMQQIVVNAGNNNQVTITLCWQAPADATVRHHTLTTYVN